MDRSRVASELGILVDMGWKVHWYREKRKIETSSSTDADRFVRRDVYVIHIESPGGLCYGEGKTHGEAYEKAIEMYRQNTMDVGMYRETDESEESGGQ